MMDPDYSLITTPLKKQIQKQYDQDIASKVVKEKVRLIALWGERKDYDAMLRVVEHEPEKTNVLFHDTGKHLVDCASCTGPTEDITNEQEQTEDLVSEFHCTSKSILKSYDILYREHIVAKSQNRSLLFENDSLRKELEALRG